MKKILLITAFMISSFSFANSKNLESFIESKETLNYEIETEKVATEETQDDDDFWCHTYKTRWLLYSYVAPLSGQTYNVYEVVTTTICF